MANDTSYKPDRRYPDELNLFQPSKFLVNILKIPTITYFCQNVRLPGVSLPAVSIPTKFLTHKEPGETVQYEQPLQIQFPVNEDFSNWLELYTWVIQLGGLPSKCEYEQVRDSNFGPTSDLNIHILTNSSNFTDRYFVFKDVFPTFLSEVNMDSTIDDDGKPVIVTALFEYDYYELKTTSIRTS